MTSCFLDICPSSQTASNRGKISEHVQASYLTQCYSRVAPEVHSQFLTLLLTQWYSFWTSLNGAVRAPKVVENLLNWLAIPRNLRMSLTFLGVAELLIHWAAARFARIPERDMTLPRNLMLLWELALANNPSHASVNHLSSNSMDTSIVFFKGSSPNAHIIHVADDTF